MKMTPAKLYEILSKEYGDLNWWPMDHKYHEKNDSDPRFEVIIGAILTQNTAWSNVEKALENLKSKNMLDIKKILDIDVKYLQELIRPSGFFNQKADRLKNISTFFHENYDGNLDRFFDNDPKILREKLLSLNGVGPETADSILLYAGDMPIFVVDAYTKRLCERLPLNVDTYDVIQDYFQKDLAKKYSKNELSKVYNKLHAQIVILAKNYCKKKPQCNNCPIKNNCNYKK